MVPVYVQLISPDGTDWYRVEAIQGPENIMPVSYLQAMGLNVDFSPYGVSVT